MPPSIFQEAESRGKFYVEAELLYWKIIQDNLIAAQERSTVEVQDPAVRPLGPTRRLSVYNSNAPMIHPDFQWEAGFRLGAGTNFENTNSDLRLRWTHNGSKVNQKFQAEGDRRFFLPNTYAKEFDVSWKSKLDMVDLALGYTMVLNRYFQARPFAGLQAIALTQDTETTYIGEQPYSLPSIPNSLYRIFVNEESTFSGLGGIIGTDLLWIFRKDLTFYGTVAAMMYHGYGKGEQQTDIQTTPTALLLRQYDLKDSGYTNKFGYNLGLGARFDRSFDKVHLGLSLGWELLTLFDQSLMSFVSNTPFLNGYVNIGSPFHTHGLVLKVVVGWYVYIYKYETGSLY